MMWIVTILKINERNCFEIGALQVESAASLEIPAGNFLDLTELVMVTMRNRIKCFFGCVGGRIMEFGEDAEDLGSCT